MRADGYPQEAWERLGRLLEERRGELNPDWANRAQFLRDTGMNKKLIERLELAKPGHYRPATLAAVSVAYGWTGDSIRRILSGGEAVARPESIAGEPALTAEDAFEEAVMAAMLPYAEKAAAVRRHRDQIREQLARLGIDPPPAFLRGGVRHLGGESVSSNDEARGA